MFTQFFTGTIVLLKCGWLFSDDTYGGKQLRRGYWDMARTDDRLPVIGHVVFVIHGIGQCMEGSDICKTTSE